MPLAQGLGLGVPFSALRLTVAIIGNGSVEKDRGMTPHANHILALKED